VIQNWSKRYFRQVLCCHCKVLTVLKVVQNNLYSSIFFISLHSSDLEDDPFAFEGADKTETSIRGRVQSAGAAERSARRLLHAHGSRPLDDTNWRTRQPPPHSITRSSSDKTNYGSVFPIRSYSFNQEDSRHYREHTFGRQLSSPADDNLSPVTYNSNYKLTKRKTPPLARSLCRYDGSALEQPPSPALSSRSPSVSYSNYSTPPSSPSGSTAFASAESSSSSPITGRTYVMDEGPTITEWTSFQTEVDVELAREDDEYTRRQTFDSRTFNLSDWQRENWFQWESLTQQNSSQKDFLEQETLV